MARRISRRQFVQGSAALGLAGTVRCASRSSTVTPSGGLQWENWASTVVHRNLKALYQPTTLDELKANVREAADNGWRLRVVGSGHAWSNLGLPEGNGAVMLMDRLNQVLGQDGNVVEVQGGISIESLNEELFNRGLALANMGDANPQSISGALSTETHGSGVTLGSISEFVEGMTLVTADGQERILEGEELEAGRVSLGQLGVIYSVKLAVLPSYYLDHQETLVRFRDEQPEIDALLENRHLEYWYYPYTEKTVRIIRNTVDSTEEINPITPWETALILVSARYAELKGRVDPAGLPDMFRTAANETTFPTIERQGPSHRILLGKGNIWREAVKTYTMEYQFPYSNLWAAFDALEDSIALAETQGVFVGSPIQFRFSKKSERSLLSHFRFSPTVSFSISFFTTSPGAHTWLPDIEQRLIALDGRPHWGKVYYIRPEKDPRFEPIRARLDPNGVFGFEQPTYEPD
ncbi:MAG: FAD-binding protein [Vicinamibacteria bacterium]